MPSAAEPPRDPGLAAERTALSWQRMALSFMSLAALTLGAAAHRGAPGLLIPAAILFAIAGLVWRYARRRIVDRGLRTTRGAIVLLGYATGVAALVAALLAFIRPG